MGEGTKMGAMIFAVLAAYYIKGVCGFASSLVFSTILSFGINNINITPVDLILKIPSNLIIAWRGEGLSDGKCVCRSSPLF